MRRLLVVLVAMVGAVTALLTLNLSPTESAQPPNAVNVVDGGATATATAIRESVGGRLDPSRFRYAGAFRVPFGEFGASNFGYGGAQIALGNRPQPTLYMVGTELEARVAEITIPTPARHAGGTAAGLPVASIVQPFADITGGLANGSIDDPRLGGMTMLDGRLHWSVWRFYNVTGDAVPGHGWSSPDLSSPTPAGIWPLRGFHNQMTAGYVFTAPQDWADAHTGGRRLIAGNTVSTATALSSSGPSFIAYRPDASGGALDALALTYYPWNEHELPGYQRPDRLAGAVWLRVGGIDSVLVVGRKSLGETRYGVGTQADCNGDQGWHGDPYQAQFMLYAAADLAAVAAGRIQPWEPRPYHVWSPPDLLPTCDFFLGGAAYDQARGRLYVSQIEADTVTDEYQPLPVVHVWDVA